MTEQINTPELRFPEFSSEWEENQLSKLTQLLKDGTHGTHKDVENGAWLLSAKILKIIILLLTNLIEKYHMLITIRYTKIINYKNDLLLSIVGTIGRTALVKDPINLAFQRSVAIIRSKIDYLNYSFCIYFRHIL